jgi:hypothetical protein
MQGPAEQIVAAANACIAVADAAGRRLMVKRPNSLDKLRMFKALGPALSQNVAYMGLAVLAFCVTEIDGVPQPQPANEAQLEALIARLGDAGCAAVAAALRPEPASEGQAGN